MESSIRDIFIFWKLNWGVENYHTLFKKWCLGAIYHILTVAHIHIIYILYTYYIHIIYILYTYYIHIIYILKHSYIIYDICYTAHIADSAGHPAAVQRHGRWPQGLRLGLGSHDAAGRGCGKPLGARPAGVLLMEMQRDAYGTCLENVWNIYIYLYIYIHGI